MFNRWRGRERRTLPLANGKQRDAPNTPNLSLFSRIATAAANAVAVSPEETEQQQQQQETDVPMVDCDDDALELEPNRPTSPPMPVPVTQDDISPSVAGRSLVNQSSLSKNQSDFRHGGRQWPTQNEVMGNRLKSEASDATVFQAVIGQPTHWKIAALMRHGAQRKSDCFCMR